MTNDVCAVERAHDARLGRDVALKVRDRSTAPLGVGHTAGMTPSEKIAISLPSALAERARRAVRRGRAASVSAYIAEALDERAKLDDLAALLDEMLEESGGPLTDAERRAADRALGHPAKRRGR